MPVLRLKSKKTRIEIYILFGCALANSMLKSKKTRIEMYSSFWTKARFSWVKIQENKDWNMLWNLKQCPQCLVKIQENKDWNAQFVFLLSICVLPLKSKKTRIEIFPLFVLLNEWYSLKSKKTRIEMCVGMSNNFFSASVKIQENKDWNLLSWHSQMPSVPVLKSKKTRIEIYASIFEIWDGCELKSKKTRIEI